MKMKIKLWSDIHLEFTDFSYNPDEEDKETTLVLAGDIGMMNDKLWNFLKNCSEKFEHVIYVIGNHESYMNIEENVLKLIRENTDDLDNFYVLHNETVILNGVKFIGTPLYSNTEHNPGEIQDIKYGIADYMRTKIMGSDGLFRFLNPHDTYLAHEEAVEFLENELQDDQGILAHAAQKENTMKTVVVTHWPPTHALTDSRYAGSPLQNYFANNDEYLMQYYDIDLWLFGHTHQALDTSDPMFYGTRIVSNARGYGNYEVPGFDKHKVIEL